MSDPVLVIALGTVWLTIGLVLSLVLGRRGHDGFMWLVIGTVLGPFAIVLAVIAVYDDENKRPIRIGFGRRRGGDIDLLVGADGSAGARAALCRAVALFGEELGRVTLARVVPFDGSREGERAAARAVGLEARMYSELQPASEVLRGNPARVLAARAVEGNYDVLVIGTRGEGRHVFGSAARELASMSPVPVLLFGGRSADDVAPSASDRPRTSADSQ